MKNFLFKNKENIKKNDGFVALFAVLVSSILLLMALSISGVAYKEQLLSINAKASQYSFTAADTGMECALYWDVNKQWYTIPNGFPNPIDCGTAQPPELLPISTLSLFVYKVNVEANANGVILPGCAIFSINKDYDSNNDNTGDSTKIESRGYNVACNNIEYGLTGVGDLQFVNGAGARAVERFLGAVYQNGN